MSRYDWGRSHRGIAHLQAEVAPARIKVVTHPLYGCSLTSHGAVLTFLEHHVCFG